MYQHFNFFIKWKYQSQFIRKCYHMYLFTFQYKLCQEALEWLVNPIFTMLEKTVPCPGITQSNKTLYKPKRNSTGWGRDVQTRILASHRWVSTPIISISSPEAHSCDSASQECFGAFGEHVQVLLGSWHPGVRAVSSVWCGKFPRRGAQTNAHSNTTQHKHKQDLSR